MTNVISVTTCSRRGDDPTPAFSGSERTSVCPAGVTNVDRTNALVRGLDLVLQHHGVQHVIRTGLSTQIHFYLDVSIDEMMWMKSAKALLAYPLAKYLRNELPTPPEQGHFKPVGAVKRWMKAHLLSYSRKNTHLWYSWLQCKKSTLDSSEEIVNKNYEDHYKVLVNKDDGDDDLINSIFEIPAFKRQLESIALETSRRWVPDSFSELEPSLSASLNSTRSESGAFGELSRYVANYDLPYTDDLVSMKYVPRLNGRSYHRSVEIRCVSYDLGDDWSSALQCAYRSRRSGTLSAKIQGIVEPMKVRVISKGPALEYYCAKPLQRIWHDILREIPCYRLIGRTLCPTDVIDLSRGTDPNWKWFSIDYKAATDNLSWKYSGRILKELTKYLDPFTQQLAWDVLGPHELIYPNAARIQSKKMERGQLMGSILSFIILCIANYGLYLSVTDQIQRGWTDSERELHCLINGDDQLYCAPIELWSQHVEKGKKLGLDMSVGKAYTHERYSNLNSTSIDLPIGGIHPYQITYLNSGLFFGISKVRSQTDQILKDKKICELLPKVLEGSLPGRQARLLGLWFQQHGSRIGEECRIRLNGGGTMIRSLFLPKSLGGMGVPCPLGWKHFVDRRQLLLASTMALKNLDFSYEYPLPSPGIVPKPLLSFVSRPYYKCGEFYIPPSTRLGKSRLKSMKHVRLPIIPTAPFLGCYLG